MLSAGLTPDSIRLRDLAARLAGGFRNRFTTTALLLGGSAAAGHSDRFSDLDLYAIAPAPPDPAERRAWLREIADAGTTGYLDEPITAGGRADTVNCAGVGVTIVWRATAEVEQAVAALLAGALEPEHEIAYGHELRQALPLHDPFDLLPIWRRTLAGDRSARSARLEARAAGQLRRALAAPSDDAALGLYPALVTLLQSACAREERYYPGPKRCPALASPAVAELIDTALSPLPVSDRLEALAATVSAEAEDVPPEPGLPESSLPLVEQGADAAGGRLLVAMERQDPLLFCHYLHRSLTALQAVGAPAGTVAELVAPGVRVESMPLVRERLHEVWWEVVRAEAWRRPEWDSRYAEAALRAGRG